MNNWPFAVQVGPDAAGWRSLWWLARGLAIDEANQPLRVEM